MAEITPIAAVAPSAPAPVAGVTPSAAPTDGSGTDFLGQLSAALKSLKALATVTAPTAGDVSADAVAPAAPEDGSTRDAGTPDDVAELLATLGLVMLPTPLSTPHTGDPAQAGATPASAQAGAALPLPLPLPQADAKAAQPETPSEATAPSLEGVMPSATPPVAHAATPVDAHAAEPAARPDTPTQAPRVDNAQPAQPAPPTTPLVQQPQLQDTTGGAFQQDFGSGDGHQKHGSSKSEPVGPADAADPAPSAQHLAEAANAVAGPAPAVAPTTDHNVRAADVAQQIAQQVDLYRLPGNKGVRIQLHPEDLGGVQVTLKYAPGGSLELHITVEHAATGSLVQEGLSQLRDALATQGFQPDRIAMSISAPASANAMDFSSSNSNSGGGYRSDVGFGGSGSDGQGQSGQQREPGFVSGAGWQPGAAADADSVSSSSSSDTARSSLAASRIDYRV